MLFESFNLCKFYKQIVFQHRYAGCSIKYLLLNSSLNPVDVFKNYI